MRKTMLISAVVFVAVFAVLISLIVEKHDDPATESVIADAQQIATRPDCDVTLVAGVQLDCLGGYSGASTADPSITVVNVWAWWCEPCRAELPLFDTLAHQHPELRVIGVHADTKAANGAALLNDLGVNMPSLQDNHNAFAGALGLPNVVPITVVLNADGSLNSFIPRAFNSYEDLEAAVMSKVQAA
ncbi:TlpA disulfide reductase family protein [Corynebacterium rouxii]|uniref:TlpA family protein disulfide reductase n=1 Tax=Corynebacterium rouxii TaxID=2719119 RepID=UPI00313DEB87